MVLHRGLPGLLASVAIAMAAVFLADQYGAPMMLLALLLGMLFNFLSVKGRCVAGIEIASEQVLQVGVALLGARITVEKISDLGAAPIASVAGAVILTILLGAAAGRLTGLGTRFGVLTGGAVAICGVSAALAIAAVLPKHEESERDTIFTVVGVTSLSTLAMVLYPLIVSLLALTPEEAGLFLGGTIHNVAQVVGAGYSVSEQTGDVATFTKLLRVSMLLPVVLGLSLVFRGKNIIGARKFALPLPGFIIAFVVLVGLNSAGAIPETLRLTIVALSRWCLVTAIAALGMKTSLKALAQVGIRPITLLVSQTLFLALLVLGFVVFVF